MSMIAAVVDKQATHMIFHTGRKGLSVLVSTYCAISINASDNGVLQLPVRFFEGSLPLTESLGLSRLPPPCIVCKTKALSR